MGEKARKKVILERFDVRIVEHGAVRKYKSTSRFTRRRRCDATHFGLCHLRKSALVSVLVQLRELFFIKV